MARTFEVGRGLLLVIISDPDQEITKLSLFKEAHQSRIQSFRWGSYDIITIDYERTALKGK